MKVSVVITAYNVEPWIERAVMSVLEQTWDGTLECIVVNDCSTDGTADVLGRLMGVYEDRLSIYHNYKNVGAGQSRRDGASYATGDYILLLDGDDWLEPDFIERLAEVAEQTDSDIVGGGITVRQTDGSWTATSYGRCTTLGTDKVAKFWGEKIVFMNNKLIRRELFEKVPYCTRRYIEDTPVIIPMLWYANRVEYVDTVGYNYRMRPSSLTHTATPIKDIIYKGLCWCDLMDFFTEHDTSIFEVLNVKGYIGNIFQAINATSITPDVVEPYREDWGELMIRLMGMVKVTGVELRSK